jgi:hypothetical protein
MVERSEKSSGRKCRVPRPLEMEVTVVDTQILLGRELRRELRESLTNPLGRIEFQRMKATEMKLKPIWKILIW